MTHLGGLTSSTVDPSQWNGMVASLPGAHLLQSREWAAIKEPIGWQPTYRAWRAGDSLLAAALILTRTIRLGGLASLLKVMYVPKGPLLQDWADFSLRAKVLSDLVKLGKDNGAIFIKIDPDVTLGSTGPGRNQLNLDPRGEAICADLRKRGWVLSQEQIQFRNTVLVDLIPSEDELLARMKQKSRYNIRLAQRSNVAIRLGNQDDIPLLARMYAETAARDGFVIRGESYYHETWRTFMANPSPQTPEAQSDPAADALIAEVEGEPVAGLILYRFASKAWYMYGMSRAVHREKMPNYLLQWEAMRRAKATGCHTYDLWGAPELDDPDDPLAGVYRFKAGLGGHYVRTIGAWDYPIRPMGYFMYTRVMPKVLEFMRRKARDRLQRQALEA
ncbi:MAG: peptidoglycan bridge formation glycyltransferase FemA/FemB family protein [Anaerolineales bacterium]|nr:peptidoglycan bridge formation glycyltransferase FemA/FemB family protein [Anaerolineales bacterium]